MRSSHWVDKDAYGNLRTPQPSSLSPLRTSHLFTGEPFDAALGLEYLRARWYAPTLGAFTRPDPYPGSPSNPRSLHPYAYAAADPVNASDPSGKMSLVETMLVTAIVNIVFADINIVASSVRGDPVSVKAAFIKIGIVGLSGLLTGAISFTIDTFLEPGHKVFFGGLGRGIWPDSGTETGLEIGREPPLRRPGTISDQNIMFQRDFRVGAGVSDPPARRGEGNSASEARIAQATARCAGTPPPPRIVCLTYASRQRLYANTAEDKSFRTPSSPRRQKRRISNLYLSEKNARKKRMSLDWLVPQLRARLSFPISEKTLVPWLRTRR